MDTAKKIFESINSKADIEELITDKREEDLHLDYKAIDGLKTPNYKKIFAKALSGYANSDGGVIVWGVDCSKNDDEVDEPKDIKPISPLDRFMSDLRSMETDLVSPPVPGVAHKPLETNGNKGCAVTLIPYSPDGPHMAKGTEHRYYKRSGETFYKMEHHDVRTAFFREVTPDLELKITPTTDKKITNTDTVIHAKILIGVFNKGRGIAKYPMMSFLKLSNGNWSPESFGKGNTSIPIVSRGIEKWYSYKGTSNNVIHPKTEWEIYRIPMVMKMGESPIVHFKYRIVAEGFSLIEDEIIITKVDVLNKLDIPQSRLRTLSH